MGKETGGEQEDISVENRKVVKNRGDGGEEKIGGIGVEGRGEWRMANGALLPKA